MYIFNYGIPFLTIGLLFATSCFATAKAKVEVYNYTNQSHNCKITESSGAVKGSSQHIKASKGDGDDRTKSTFTCERFSAGKSGMFCTVDCDGGLHFEMSVMWQDDLPPTFAV